MRGKHLGIKKLVISSMVLLSVVAHANPAFAMSSVEAVDYLSNGSNMTFEMGEIPSNKMLEANDVVADAVKRASFEGFKDYNKDLGYGKLKGHWAERDIRTLYERGGISGYPEGDFRANKTITGAELIALILSASNNGDNLQGNTWSDKIMNRAYELGIVTEADISKADANKPISREKMALILVNSADKILREDTKGIKLVDEAVIADLNNATVSYRDEIRIAYSLGLLAGTGNGAYQPKASTTRAEASAIINRLFEYTNRVEVKYTADKPATQTTQQGTYTPGVYKALPDGSNVGKKTGYIYPAEGLIGPGNKPITRDPLTGVLGFGNGQKGGIYLGIKYENGKQLRVNSTPTPDTIENMGGHYEQRGDYVYWTAEWAKIEGAMVRKLNAEHPNVADGTLADLHGNILSTKDESNKDVFFKYYAKNETWKAAGQLF